MIDEFVLLQLIEDASAPAELWRIVTRGTYAECKAAYNNIATIKERKTLMMVVVRYAK